jgi:signal transduction histidine kinase
MLAAHYDTKLVLASVLVAILAIHIALSVAGRMARRQGAGAGGWLAGGTVALGTGIWAMHFLGMPALRLPIALGYDVTITVVSALLAAAVAAYAIWHVSQPQLEHRQLLRSGAVMGAGMAAMHYIGMAAMLMAPAIHYSALPLLASIAAAFVVSIAVLWCAHRLRNAAPYAWLKRAACAVPLGGLVAGTHFLAMAAARFPADGVCMAASNGLGQDDLALMVMLGTGAVLALAMLTEIYDRLLEQRSRKLTQMQAAAQERQAMLARERAARTEVERVSDMKDEFLAVVSHELRTPLNAIVGWANLLREGVAEPATLRKGLDTIERNARAQAQLIDDLLDMSKVVSGKVELAVEAVDPVALLDAAVESARPGALAKNIRLQKSFDVCAVAVAGDPRRLQQVLWNLLTNAIKFTPKGGAVAVSLQEADGAVKIAVTDSGVGIKPEFLPYVFERFRQADASITRRYGGLGLGLSIVKHLVELHGGTVEAGSAGTGLGATFTVTLPVRGAQRASGAPALPGSPSLAGLKLLVVDDVRDTLDLLERVLSDAGAQVVTAESAAQAMAWLEHEHADVILSDLGMPDMDGFELMRRVRAQGDTAPAIALTAFARREDRELALAAGYTRHMGKPVEPRELIAAVAAVAA